MKHCITLVFLLLLAATVGTAKQNAIIHGKVSNPREEVVRISMYADLITFEPMQYTAILQSDNTFKFDIHLSEPTVATVIHGNSSMEIYLEPEHQLGLQFDGWDIPATAQFSGTAAANNLYFIKAEEKFQRLSEEYITHKMSGMSAEDFKIYMDKLRQKKLAFFERYRTTYNFTPSFEVFALADIEYWWAHQLMRYRWEHAFYNDLPAPLKLSNGYYSFLNEIKILNDGALSNLKYLYFLDQYLEYTCSQNIRYNAYGAPIQEEYRGAKRFLKGKPMYYVVANELYIKCRNKDTYSIGNDVMEFLDECPFTAYTDLIRTEFKQAKGLAAGTPAPNFTLVNSNGERMSLSDFRGKVVYIDFWATWCMPCTYEILNSTNLKSQFQGKDVVFLYISLDTNMDSWRSFLYKHKPEGIHLFAKGMYNSEVAQQYSVRGLPSFFLIDKDGNLARVPAKRSSEPGAYEEIEEVLTK